MCYTTYFNIFAAKLQSLEPKKQTVMLNEKIGNNAGLVWSALSSGELNVKAVKKATKLTDKDLYLALGWLARESKISFNEVDGELFITLA